MILLDTHSLIWVAEKNPRLGPDAKRIEAESDQVYVSAITAWELGLLVGRGKLTLNMPIELWLQTSAQNGRTSTVPVTSDIALRAGLLPEPIHGDPGDRIIIATARALGCPLLTADHAILDYAAAGHVRAIDARR